MKTFLPFTVICPSKLIDLSKRESIIYRDSEVQKAFKTISYSNNRIFLRISKKELEM